MARRYASETGVSTAKSRNEIERLLASFGATAYGTFHEPGRAILGFEIRGRRIRFIMPLPDPNERQFTHTPQKAEQRHPDDARRHWEQACRSRWRGLLLILRAKIEAIEGGVSTFEHEFLPHIILPDGLTVADHAVPMIEQAYETGETPPLLPPPERTP